MDQRSIYISKPEFWRKFREELIIIRKEEYNDSKQKFERQWEKVEYYKHRIFEKLLMLYTPLWLKTDIVSEIICYQEGLSPYEPNMRLMVERQILLKQSVIQFENVTNKIK